MHVFTDGAMLGGLDSIERLGLRTYLISKEWTRSVQFDLDKWMETVWAMYVAVDKLGNDWDPARGSVSPEIAALDCWKLLPALPDASEDEVDDAT
jgi:hypothetical protein